MSHFCWKTCLYEKHASRASLVALKWMSIPAAGL
jgi:hypothetical protein